LDCDEPGAGPMNVLAWSTALPSTLYSAAGSGGGGFGISGVPPGLVTIGLEYSPVGQPNSYRSTDDGATWTLLPNSPANVFVITCDPVNPSILYAAGSSQGTSIYRSADGGNTWNKTVDLPLTNSTFALASSHAHWTLRGNHQRAAHQPRWWRNLDRHQLERRRLQYRH
jgi:hypothetical protein